METESCYPPQYEIIYEYKTKYVSSGFINRQDPIDKHYVTNPEGLNSCGSPWTDLDPSIKPSNRKYVSPNTVTLIKFYVFNGEIHIVKDILCEFPKCTTSGYSHDLSSMSSNTDELKCSLSRCHNIEIASYSTSHSHVSRTKERVFKLNKRASSPWKPNFLNNRKPCFQKKNNYGIRKCYKCDEPSHKVGNYTFEENTKRVGNILICNNKWFKKIL